MVKALRKGEECIIGKDFMLIYDYRKKTWQWWKTKPDGTIYKEEELSEETLRDMGRLPVPNDDSAKELFEMWEEIQNMGLLSRHRCQSVLYTEGGPIQCIGASPMDGESHTHVGRRGALRITWTDKDAEESQGVSEKHEPFTGWRVWELTKGGFLRSVTSQTVWPGPTLRAHGRPYSHIMGERSPHGNDEVDYGIYCYKSPKLLYDHMRHGIKSQRWPIIGAIDLTGHVVEHTKGYRAEVATFRKLWYIVYDEFTLSFGDGLARELEKRYQCDVERIPKKQVRHWADYLTSELEENDGSW